MRHNLIIRTEYHTGKNNANSLDVRGTMSTWKVFQGPRRSRFFRSGKFWPVALEALDPAPKMALRDAPCDQ